MDRLVHFTITHARFTWLLIVTALLAGTGIFLTQPRQEDPEITLRGNQIMTRMPGLSPERVELLITRPIEEAIKTMPEIKEIKSVSSTGLSLVSPEVDSQYTDMTPIWAKLRNKMQDLHSSLPEGSSVPMVPDDFGQVAVVTLALTGEDFSPAELHSIARDVQHHLSALPLVGRVDLYGVQQERIWIEFDPAFMAQFGLTANKVMAALRAQNVLKAGGTVNAGGQSIVIEPSGELKSLEEIRSVAVETDSGLLVYLDDLATIERGYSDPPSGPSFYNGKPAIVIGVSMVSKSNVVELGKQVRGALGELGEVVPQGADLEVAIFQPDLVQASVMNATNNLLQTILVVLAVVMTALGWRTGLIVGAMVPLTMMVTLIGMSIWGIELHRISIAAIIVALGLLVDNGVVVAEDIKRRLDAGAERMDATLATTRSLATPLLTSSLTTVAAFMPLVLITGGSGEFLRSLGQVLALALLGSWFVAMTVIPAFCYWFMGGSKADSGAASDGGERSRGQRFYAGLLGLFLRQRMAFMVALGLLLFASMAIFSQVKQRSLGPSERNQFTVYVDLPAEASIQESMAVTARLSEYLMDKEANPEVSAVLGYVGSGGPRFFLSLSPNDPQPNKAFLVVNTLEPKDIAEVMPRVDRYLIEEVPEATGRTDILFLGSAPLGTVEIRVTGPKLNTLRSLGAQIKDSFHTVPGIVSVRSDWENAVFKMRVDIDQERASRAGVAANDVASVLTSYFDGTGVTTYREGETSIPVMVRANARDRGSLDRVRTVEVLSATSGAPVPLLQIADFEGVVEPSRIRRFDQERALTIAGKHPDKTSMELYSELQATLDSIEMPVGYRLSVEGEIRESAESNGKLFEYAPHALFAILLLLVLQFNSFRRPAIILMTIPLVLIGANFGLFAFNGYFDFTAMLGLFSLAGIIINNGIVLIDKVDEGRAAGLDVDEAVLEAALARVRPIIMTTITTVVGLIPLALFGGEFWYGMAIVIMCGISVGTVLTLGFVPVLYSLLFNLVRAKADPDPIPEPELRTESAA